MKKISFYTLMLALSLMAFISCEKETPSPNPAPPKGVHFDLWSPLASTAGMGGKNYIVKRTNSLEDGEIDFKGSGVDLSQKLYPETIIKGKYYYQITKEKRFGKYQILEKQLVTVKEFPFTTLKEYRYTHAWLDHKTLLLMGANGESTKILWVKVDTEAMTEIANGELNLPAPNKGERINTSGIAAYRKADNRVLYSYDYKNDKSPRKAFYMAFINPADMSVVKIVTENRAEFMAGTAYGELRQEKAFFDENGDYYLACNSVLPGEVNGKGKVTTTAQHGALLRVKSGAMEFDKSYNGYNRERGKIITATYLNNGKAILYMQDPQYATPENKIWDSSGNPYVFYWLIADLKTGAITDLKEIPFSNGNFSQLAVVMGKKAYIGVNPKSGQSHVMVYDIATEKLTKGISIAEGHTLDRITRIEE